MAKGYFLLIDKEKNTVLIPTDDEFIADTFKRNDFFRDRIKRHKTRAELNTEVSDYLKGGYKIES